MNKPKPLLQIALDTLTTNEAIAHVEKVKANIDVIEVGTILIASVGQSAVQELACRYPRKIIVADGKIADAGTIFGQMFFGSGATYTTVICAAEIATIKSVLTVAKQYGKEHDVQVELTSNYTSKQVDEWIAAGIKQVVYHRSRDAQAADATWQARDINNVRQLASKGLQVTVTGGITIANIKLFRGIPIYIFIAGRALRDAPNPAQMAASFQAEIRKYWS